MSSRIARKNLRMEKKMFKTIAYMLGKFNLLEQSRFLIFLYFDDDDDDDEYI